MLFKLLRLTSIILKLQLVSVPDAGVLRQHKLGDARKHLQKALMLQPNNIIAIGLLAETELKDGNPDKSLEYAKALQTTWRQHLLVQKHC